MSARLLLALVACLVIAAPAAAQRSPDISDPTRLARLDGVFREYDSRTSPGCAVGLYRDGRIVASRAYGMANLDHDVPLAPSSVFHVASVSKQFTAAAILLLAADGRLSLDDDVRKYVPELPDFGAPITIRQLGHHTSGLRDQWSLLGLAGWRYSRDLITDDDVLDLLARQKHLNFEPGERHLYSNSGYTLMAIIVSRVSGQSFRAFTSERIFAPLGMTNTHFRDAFGEIVKGQAYGYAREGGTYRLSVTNFDTAGATSLLTTVEDMVRWHANFDTRRVGGERLIDGLLTRGVLFDGQSIDYAFGITHGTYRGLATIGHGGADAGYRSAFLRFPQQRFGVATLCNVASANPTELSRRVADIYLAGLLHPEPGIAADDAAEVPLADEGLSALAGLYWNASESSARRFVVGDGRLHAVMGRDRVPLKSLGEGRFVTASGTRAGLVFETPAGGAPILKVGDGTPSDVFQRVEPFVPTVAQLQEFSGVYRSDEIESVYRMTVRGGALHLERLKSRPAPLEPLVAHTFGSPVGTIRFERDAAGVVTGFVLEAGRIRNVRFARDRASGS
jgi:CubicO group peptidase (beta-lactamase class C family)